MKKFIAVFILSILLVPAVMAQDEKPQTDSKCPRCQVNKPKEKPDKEKEKQHKKEHTCPKCKDHHKD